MSEEKKKLNFRTTWKNNWFMLKMIQKASPILIPVQLFGVLLNSIASFLGNTYLYMYVLNSLQAHTPLLRILSVVLGLAFITLLDLGMRALGWYITDTQQPKVDRYINQVLSDKAAAVELGCFESPEFYDTYVKAMDAATNRAMGVLNTVLSIIWCVTHIIAVGTLIATIHPAFLLLSLIPILLTLIMGKKRNKMSYDREMRNQEVNRQVDYVNRTFYLKDFSAEMRLTKMYRLMYERLHTSIKELSAIVKEYGYGLMWIYWLFDIVYSVVVYYVSILLAAYLTLVRKTMPLGSCFVIINSITDISYAFGGIGNIYLAMDENARYVENMRKFLEYKITIAEDSKAALPQSFEALELSHIDFTYEGAEHAVLNDISLSIHKGEKIALVGENGAGKTTLIKLLLRLYDPSAGSILCKGTNIKKLRLSAYRDLFGTVFQDYRLFSLSVAENVMLNGNLTEEDRNTVWKSLEQSGLQKRIEALPDGIDTIITREFADDGVVFSGGEAQKLSIARIFAKQPEIVIMDEPTSALDPIAENEMYRNMFHACENSAMVFISHRLSSAAMADHIYYLENGRIVESGTHTMLLSQNGKYAAMWKKQAQRYHENNQGEVNFLG